MEERSYGKPFSKSGKPGKGRKPFRSNRNEEEKSYGSTNRSRNDRNFKNTEGEDRESQFRERRNPRHADKPFGSRFKSQKDRNFRTNENEEREYQPRERRNSRYSDKPYGDKFKSRNERSFKKRDTEEEPAQPRRKEYPKFDKRNQMDREELQKSHYSKKKQLEYQLKQPPKDGLVRLNKFIANTGICSRREADEYIKEGKITINGEVVTEVGTKVNMNDDVCLEGNRITPEAKVYLVLNKPKDFVTTMDDPLGRKTVMNLIQTACRERVYPIGRLDRMTTGVLLFTNDGELTKKLTHPKYNKKKIYHVFLDKPITKQEIQQIADGLELEDGFVQSDAISYVDQEDKRQIGIEIHSGKNRIVRRIFEHLGYKVEKLDRVYFAGITKKNLPRGRWRFLTPEEVSMLKNF